MTLSRAVRWAATSVLFALVAACANGTPPWEGPPPVEAGAAPGVKRGDIDPTKGERDASSGDAANPAAAYPARPAMRVKGIRPDAWPNRDDVALANAGGVLVDLAWSTWEPRKKAPPCIPREEEEHEGRCFVTDVAADAEVLAYTARGLVVSAVVYGVPSWAQGSRGCAAGHELACAADDPADVARFAGMLARRYDGFRGHGRVADFVLHRGANDNLLFDVGCGQSAPCDANVWVDTYAAEFALTYDRIVAAQPFAKVLVPLDQHFGAELDALAPPSPRLSGQTFLARFADRVKPRAWRVAVHPAPPDVRTAASSPDDLPIVSLGSLGALSGWLRRTFPAAPWAWEVQVTGGALSSHAPSSAEAQAAALCSAFRNVLGTPGVESFIYPRMRDRAEEVAVGLTFGLRDTSGIAKLAWGTWAESNRPELGATRLACGFEDLPHARLFRSYHPTRGHWASSRVQPDGFVVETSWKVAREPAPATSLLYECKVGEHAMLSLDVACEGFPSLGPVGWVHQTADAARHALYRCRAGTSNVDHFVSTDPGCEGNTVDTLLGYVIE